MKRWTLQSPKKSQKHPEVEYRPVPTPFGLVLKLSFTFTMTALENAFELNLKFT